jgi:hypothetical protein
MHDRAIEAIVRRREQRSVDFETLMSWRVRRILLVSSMYDAFSFQEDASLTERLFSEYLDLNLRYAPTVVRASTAAEALELLRQGGFDLVVSMARIGDADVREFVRAVREIDAEIPVKLLAGNARELAALEAENATAFGERLFVWSGDVRLLLAMVKSTEDRMNAAHDSRTAGVPNLILIEDSVRFYSSYLPLLYTELMAHSQALMADGLNSSQKLLRMRARPKILLATSYEEGETLFREFRDHVMGVILDASFPRGGKVDDGAGMAFARLVRAEAPDRPILMQSSEAENAAEIERLGGSFIDKTSPTLLQDLRRFLREYLGFAEFVFRSPDGAMIAAASDLRTLQERIAEVPIESLLYHGGRNDFSTWLMNRTEFELARDLRPQRVEDFRDPEDMRGHLVAALERHRDRSRAGVIADFSSATFEGKSGFARIGSGSLGGKGRGLAFVHALLEDYEIGERFPSVEISVPPTAVLATDVFDRFMADNDLVTVALGGADDAEIARRFAAAALPVDALAALRTFLARVDYPLAVRSSSLLEDGAHQPFAGVYQTCMIPNNGEDIEARLAQLSAAVKRVYASTYFESAKAYIAATSNRLEEEKMAIAIQQIVGRRYGDYLYPLVAGVARSHNFYPMKEMRSEDGIASAVLGLGKAVVDGGRCVRFSPRHAERLYQFATPEESLRTAPSELLALDMRAAPWTRCEAAEADTNIVALGLDVAEAHGTLHAVGSVYDAASHAVYDGISRSGPRLVTLAGVLKGGVFPLAEVLSFLLEVGGAAFSCPVEIEFAADLRQGPREKHQFGFLQIRPVIVGGGSGRIHLAGVAREDAICVSDAALGNGPIAGVADLVYVPVASFERSKTAEVAREIGIVNGRLVAEGRPYALVGPGRWGSADHWLGIPVSWGQISRAACIVETDMHDIKVEPSQGSHFFQNMTSLGVAYLTVNFDQVGGHLDLPWLDAQPAQAELRYVRHLRFDAPLDIAVDGRAKRGVIMKPGRGFGP